MENSIIKRPLIRLIKELISYIEQDEVAESLLKRISEINEPTLCDRELMYSLVDRHNSCNIDKIIINEFTSMNDLCVNGHSQFNLVLKCKAFTCRIHTYMHNRTDFKENAYKGMVDAILSFGFTGLAKKDPCIKYNYGFEPTLIN